MRSFSSSPRWLLLLTPLVLALVPSARADLIVAPNANASVAGNTDNRFPFLVTGGMRYQQVFAASQFAALSGPTFIDAITFRSGILVNTAFTSTISDIQISLSTISAGPDGLSATFASNVGANVTTVYNGSLTLSSTNVAGPGNTKVFDITINFQQGFLYNPASGNLLLDVLNRSGANAFVDSEFFDAVNTTGDPVSRVWGAEGSPTATAGTVDSLGLIAQFTTRAVPEPSSLALCGVAALIGLGAVRLRRRV